MENNSNISKCYLCIDEECQTARKLMEDIEDTRAHWGHRSEKLTIIRTQLLNQKNQERFQKLKSEKEIFQEIQNSFKQILDELTLHLYLKQIEFEKEIEEMSDSNVNIKHLYSEIQKDVNSISINYLKKYDSDWRNLMSPDNDSYQLSEKGDQIRERINELKNNIQQTLDTNLSQRKLFKDLDDLKQEKDKLSQMIQIQGQNFNHEKEQLTQLIENLQNQILSNQNNSNKNLKQPETEQQNEWGKAFMKEQKQIMDQKEQNFKFEQDHYIKASNIFDFIKNKGLKQTISDESREQIRRK